MRLTDGLVEVIESRIASRRPEHGGVLLATGDLFHTLIDDEHGGYSGSHWDVSDEVVALCDTLQRRRFGAYGGQIHSHPDGVPDPSGPDRELMTSALARNPGRDYLLLPVVTRGVPREGDIAIGPDHRMSIHIAVRSERGPEVLRASAVVVPLTRTLREANVKINAFTSTDDDLRTHLPKSITLNGQAHLAVAAPAGVEGYLLHTGKFPDEPIQHLAPNQERTPQITPVPDWDATRPGESLRAYLRSLTTPPAEREQAFVRVAPIVGDLAERTVLVAGLGSVGSRICEDLVRSGVGNLILLDPDTVSPPNLARSVYTAGDVGSPKVKAMASRLAAINPRVSTTLIQQTLGAAADLATLVERADLVVGATDDMQEQRLLNHVAYSLGRPMVVCALYRRAAAGEVAFSLPKLGTPCIFCAISDLSPDVRPEKDYGAGGRLVAEHALGPSINLVASFASLVALGVVSGPEAEAAQVVRPLVSTGRTYGKISSVNDWDFFPSLFEGMAHQHAPQSVWIRTRINEQCGTCGSSREPIISHEDGLALARFLGTVGSA